MPAQRLSRLALVGAMGTLTAASCASPGRAALERAETMLRSDPALALLKRFETHARLRKADDLYDLVGLFSMACRRSCTGFRAHVVDLGGGYQVVRWVPRISPGTLLLDRGLSHGLGDLLRALASFGRLESITLDPLRMRRFRKRALVRARLLVRGIDRSGARRVDSGLVDLDLRVRAARWRIDDFRVARVHTVRRALPAYAVSRAAVGAVEVGRSTPRALIETPAGLLTLEVRGRELWARSLDGQRRRKLGELRQGPVRTIAVADLDGDGASDLVVGSAGDDSTIWLARGSTFVPLGAWGVKGPVSAVVAADLDGDGAVDLLVGREKGPDLLWRGPLVPRSTRGPRTPSPRSLASTSGSSGLCVADLDGDGHLDVLRVSYRGPSTLLLGRGERRWSRVPIALGGAATSCALGDVDGDGRLDLFIGERGARSAYLLGRSRVAALGWRPERPSPGGSLWLNRGRPKAPRFVRAAALRDAVGWTGWAAFCDHDADGDLDLWRRRLELPRAQERRFWFASRRRASPRLAGLRWRGQELWLGDGRGSLAAATFAARLPSEASGDGLALDLDGDGRLELLGGQGVARWRGSHDDVGEPGAGAAVLLRLRMPDGRNRDAIGAIVRLRADGRWQTRVVGLATGWPGGAPGWVHVGLGAALRIERLELRWPDGRRETHEDLPARKLIVLSPGAPPRWSAFPTPKAAPTTWSASKPAPPALASKPISRPTSRPLTGPVAALAALGQLLVQRTKGETISLAALLGNQETTLLISLERPTPAQCKRLGGRPLTVGPSAAGCAKGRHLRVQRSSLARLRVLLPAIVRWKQGVKELQTLTGSEG